MRNIGNFLKEHRRIVNNSLVNSNQQADLSKLREICLKLEEEINYDFKTQYSDVVFWQTCNEFIRKLQNPK